jgi:hypothetical protein
MCIAIYHNANCVLSESEIRASWNNNPDGGGFSYFDQNGDIKIEKHMKLKQFMAAYYDAIDKHASRSPFSVHFRIATHGGVNIENCHPFMPNGGTSLIHNGIIPVLFNDKDKRSDTRVFVEEYLPRLGTTWFDDEYLFDMVSEYIGGSKLVVLSNLGMRDWYIINEHKGHWSSDNNYWYSNSSYKSASVSCATGPFVSGKQLSIYNSEDLHAIMGNSDSEYDDYPLGECIFCASNAVYDEVCYECETCQKCSLSDNHCKCYNSIHSMTDHEYARASRA